MLFPFKMTVGNIKRQSLSHSQGFRIKSNKNDVISFVMTNIEVGRFLYILRNPPGLMRGFIQQGVSDSSERIRNA